MGQIRVHMKFWNCDPDEKLVSTQIFGVKLLLTEYFTTFSWYGMPFEFQF